MAQLGFAANFVACRLAASYLVMPVAFLAY